jgi:peptide chain release factor subunit 1
MSDGQPLSECDKQVEIWKVKKLIKGLQAARGNGTSMISLVIPPKDQISRIGKLLVEEYGTASHIKSRVNRLSVLSAITSAQQRVKLYTKVPNNGLIIYCGTILTDEVVLQKNFCLCLDSSSLLYVLKPFLCFFWSQGKEKRVNIDFEPFKPINTSLYLCDNKFHTEALGIK